MTALAGLPRGAALLLLGAALVGCAERALGLAGLVDGGPGSDFAGPRPPRDALDLLIVMDDTRGTEPANTLLTKRLPDLLAIFDRVATGRSISYHIGVVTTDLGAPGIPCGIDRGARLQPLAAAARAGCKGPVGARYLARDGDRINLPEGQDLATTLGCMLAVGQGGCDFEMPLEAAYRALHDPIPENLGFLRPEAALAVLFFTDEDDCSVDASSELFGADPALGPLSSYRCSRFGLVCDGKFPLPADETLSAASCEPATPAQGGRLSNLGKYVDFFAKPAALGGVKGDPRDVLLAAISGPLYSFGTARSDRLQDCLPGQPPCLVLKNACSGGGIGGAPGVRLRAVVKAASSWRASSICDPDYQTTLSSIASLMGVL